MRPARRGGSRIVDQPVGIDKSVLAVAAPRRYRNREHLRYVAKQPCLVCGRKPSDPHHLRFVQPRALGRKASDEFAVPLCRIHHRLVHRVGNEAAWWQEAGIDPIKAARKLWRRHAHGRRPDQRRNQRPQPPLQIEPQASRSSDRDVDEPAPSDGVAHAYRSMTAARRAVSHRRPAPRLPISLIDGHRETWPVRSVRFRAWLRRQYYEATGEAPSAAA